MRYYISYDVIREVQKQEYDIIKKLKNLKSSFLMNDDTYKLFKKDLESKLRLIKYSLSNVTNESDKFYTLSQYVYSNLHYMYNYNKHYRRNIS